MFLLLQGYNVNSYNIESRDFDIRGDKNVPFIHYSTHHRLIVRFTSDSSVVKRGFSATYTAISESYFTYSLNN